ncbi:MAG: hypothetical protein WBW33_09405, partial [Bryobacteraceae bacterium]
TVTLGWNGKTIEKSLEDLVNNQATAPAAAAAAAQPGAGEPAMPKPPAPVQTAAKQGEPGIKLSDTVHGCVTGDTSPNGTISSDGFKKIVKNSPFGPTCDWVKQ